MTPSNTSSIHLVFIALMPSFPGIATFLLKNESSSGSIEGTCGLFWLEKNVFKWIHGVVFGNFTAAQFIR